MSPKMYGFLWLVFGVLAGILFVGGVFTLMTAVVFGFVAFGLTFMGMMCVLPGTVSHPPVKKERRPAADKSAAHQAAGFNTYRHV